MWRRSLVSGRACRRTGVSLNSARDGAFMKPRSGSPRYVHSTCRRQGDIQALIDQKLKQHRGAPAKKPKETSLSSSSENPAGLQTEATAEAQENDPATEEESIPLDHVPGTRTDSDVRKRVPASKSNRFASATEPESAENKIAESSLPSIMAEFMDPKAHSSGTTQDHQSQAPSPRPGRSSPVTAARDKTATPLQTATDSTEPEASELTWEQIEEQSAAEESFRASFATVKQGETVDDLSPRTRSEAQRARSLVSDEVRDKEFMSDEGGPPKMTSVVTLEALDQMTNKLVLKPFLDRPSLYISFGGGDPTAMTIYAAHCNEIFSVNVGKLGRQAFLPIKTGSPSLRRILESSKIQKVFFDVRRPCQILTAQYGIQLRCVDDLQAMEAACRPKPEFQSFERCIRDYLITMGSEKNDPEWWLKQLDIEQRLLNGRESTGTRNQLRITHVAIMWRYRMLFMRLLHEMYMATPGHWKERADQMTKNTRLHALWFEAPRDPNRAEWYIRRTQTPIWWYDIRKTEGAYVSRRNRLEIKDALVDIYKIHDPYNRKAHKKALERLVEAAGYDVPYIRAQPKKQVLQLKDLVGPGPEEPASNNRGEGSGEEKVGEEEFHEEELVEEANEDEGNGEQTSRVIHGKP